jgi:hypothetical protein
MDFFRTLIRPDHEKHPERAKVGRAANLLQIGEFQFLQLAYREWFGHEIPPTIVDHLFDSYMIDNRVPFWARHHARKIIALDAGGNLDDADPAYHRYDSNYVVRVPHGVRHFIVAMTIVIGFVFGGLLVGHYSVGEGGSIMPPYFEKGELVPIKAKHNF